MCLGLSSHRRPYRNLDGRPLQAAFISGGMQNIQHEC